MSARGPIAIITYERDHFSKLQRHTPSFMPKDIKEAIWKVRTFFEMEKNAGKIMIPIDKSREITAAALGVSLRTVDRVYLES